MEEIVSGGAGGGVYGDPGGPLRWTTWSLRKIAAELSSSYGIEVSRNVVLPQV